MSVCRTVAAALAVLWEPRVALAAAVAEEDARGGAAMAQWVTDGRIRGVAAVFQRTGPEVEAEEEEGEELAAPAITTRGLLIRAIRNATRSPARLLKGSIMTRLVWFLGRRLSRCSWRVFWLLKAISRTG